jgi:hypothetical protein
MRCQQTITSCMGVVRVRSLVPEEVRTLSGYEPSLTVTPTFTPAPANVRDDNRRVPPRSPTRSAAATFHAITFDD